MSCIAASSSSDYHENNVTKQIDPNHIKTGNSSVGRAGDCSEPQSSTLISLGR
ncbi:hypothetical protein Glove_423g30 [Diversispora epigaea]|uniref:Uncharacterized protein n=1 Tax=Diversispora epigaea TaxID=1348612 RepID=A0A397GWX6_9GLOM|nr:hypothetical protein Glove_423g30 [Diversispora epigaea]